MLRFCRILTNSTKKQEFIFLIFSLVRLIYRQHEKYIYNVLLYASFKFMKKVTEKEKMQWHVLKPFWFSGNLTLVQAIFGVTACFHGGNLKILHPYLGLIQFQSKCATIKKTVLTGKGFILNVTNDTCCKVRLIFWFSNAEGVVIGFLQILYAHIYPPLRRKLCKLVCITMFKNFVEWIQVGHNYRKHCPDYLGTIV